MPPNGGGIAATRGMSALAALAWAGIVAPVLFIATFLAQEALRRGEFNPVAEPVSALEAGPSGWVQQLNFVVFGLLTMAHATGLHRGMRPARGVGRICAALPHRDGCLGGCDLPVAEDAAALPTHQPLTLSGE